MCGRNMRRMERGRKKKKGEKRGGDSEEGGKKGGICMKETSYQSEKQNPRMMSTCSDGYWTIKTHFLFLNQKEEG